jgi:hypothetical protein
MRRVETSFIYSTIRYLTDKKFVSASKAFLVKHLILILVHLAKSPALNLIQKLLSMGIKNSKLIGLQDSKSNRQMNQKGWGSGDSKALSKLPQIDISQNLSRDRPRWGTDHIWFRCPQRPLSSHIAIDRNQCFLADLHLVRNILRTL